MSAWQPGPRNAITDVPGIRVGHYTDRRAATGCTVILCPTAQAAAVDARGGAPGTRETDVLGLANLVRTCHAILFAGGSAFGLAAAEGVMRWCSEHGIGVPTTKRPVPIVPAAVIYDLTIGDPYAFPGAHEGYLAAVRARRGTVAEGSTGAGTGATIAKLLGPERALKGGLGTASLTGPRGFIVGALVVTNALGSIYDPATGECLAAPRGDRPGEFLTLPDTLARRTVAMDPLLAAPTQDPRTAPPSALENTTLMCIATNARLAPEDLQRLAIHAHDGFARCVVPAHTRGDGDIAFALSTGECPATGDDLYLLGTLTSAVVETAILRAIRLARGTKQVPAANEWRPAPA
ncbi:P1 family peptidase [Tepidiforma sp.]|uniref:P1 family peptidase n=1 Tax=Tepidiforma sp. TaxID=2682230 RepID=UPI002ADD540E|nr:P1 family peptidase [Tepidiforma sp.]